LVHDLNRSDVKTRIHRARHSEDLTLFDDLVQIIRMHETLPSWSASRQRSRRSLMTCTGELSGELGHAEVADESLDAWRPCSPTPASAVGAIRSTAAPAATDRMVQRLGRRY
jgi:hypothetical protein